MGISDMIACFIREMLEDESGSLEIKRGELAERFDCVPSQINYVISTRFSPEHGYLVESRRGGGGYIRIQRVPCDCGIMLMHTVNAIGQAIDQTTARSLIQNLLYGEEIDRKTAALLTAAVSDGAFRALPPEWRDTARAGVLKQMLTAAG